MFKTLVYQFSDDVSFDQFFDTVLESFHLQEEIQQHINDYKLLKTTLNDLVLLHTNISENGMSVELLRFVNAGNQLSNHIQNIPSLESLTNNFPKNGTAALEGIGKTIVDIVKRILISIKNIYSKIITYFKLRNHSVEELRKKLSEYQLKVAHKSFNVETFNTISSKIIQYHQLIELIEIATNINTITLELTNLKLPESHEDAVEFHKSFENIVDTHLNKYSITLHDVIVQPKVHSARYQEMGYSETAFEEINKHLELYIQDILMNENKIKSIFNRQLDEVERRINELSVNVNNGRYTITYCTKAATILEEAFDQIIEFPYHIAHKTWKWGILYGVKAIRDISRCYE